MSVPSHTGFYADARATILSCEPRVVYLKLHEDHRHFHHGVTPPYDLQVMGSSCKSTAERLLLVPHAIVEGCS